MKQLRHSTMEDLVSLQMENELLVAEARHLRARLRSAEREGGGRAHTELQTRFSKEQQRADRQFERAERVQGKLKEAKDEVESQAARIDELEADLRWLIHRFNDLPGVGSALRRTEGFRTILARYPKR